MKPIIMFPGLAVLCAGLGWVAGDREKPESHPSSEITSQGKSAERLPTLRGRAVPAEIEERLRTLRAATTPQDRLRAMTELANSIPVSELAAWYEAGWIERRETMESLQFYHITRQRWLTEDGAGMMDHYLKKDRAGVSDLALDWGKVDPAAAFGFGEALTDESDRSTLMGSIAAAASEVHPEIALKALARYNPPRSGTSWGIDSIIDSVAKADPELLRREIANLPANLARGAKRALATERLKTDFAAGVAAFAVEKDGKQQFISAIQSSMELTKQMLERPGDLPEGWLADLLAGNNVSLVGRDPKRWLELDLESLGLPEERVKAVQNYALGRTLYSHPERLHEILSAGNLSPEARNQAIHSAVASLGTHDRAKAAELIAQLADPAEKAFAQARLDETQEREEMPFLRTPEELGKLAALKGSVDVTNVMSGWGGSDGGDDRPCSQKSHQRKSRMRMMMAIS